MSVKNIIKHCKICGDVILDETYVGGYDGEQMIFPTEIWPTIRSVAIAYKKIVGCSYQKNTGNSACKSFTKQWIDLSHESIDEVGIDKLKDHSIGLIECWVEDI